MRYKTEFKISPDAPVMDKYVDKHIEYLKRQHASNLGNLIVKHTGFEHDQNDPELKHTLEVQVFAMKDWHKFKNLLKEYIESASKIGLSTFNLIVIGKMFKELENAGMPEEQKIPG